MTTPGSERPPVDAQERRSDTPTQQDHRGGRRAWRTVRLGLQVLSAVLLPIFMVASLLLLWGATRATSMDLPTALRALGVLLITCTGYLSWQMDNRR